MMKKDRRRTIIMGAAGRDFHNFNTLYRDNAQFDVVAFTATQIPNIDNRKYPAELAGDLYPEGIPIKPEDELENLIRDGQIDEVIFSYSDVPYDYVMGRAARVIAAGADFRLLGAQETMLSSGKPVVAVVAVRTGCGKSQTTRRVAQILKDAGKKVVVVRHPMPYGDLAKQSVQRFSTLEDLAKNECTIEEMEEYEPHIKEGTTVFAGVDYQAILKEAEQEADVILWDGGNNDTPFYKPDRMITVVDPHRPGHELRYYPGEINLRMADIVVINKVDTAKEEGINQVRDNVRLVNPEAVIIEAESPISVEDPAVISNQRVLVVEDGPTLTHGDMKFGAGTVAAEKFGAQELVDPRPFAVNSITATYRDYPDIGVLLPAMGYGEAQIQDLETTINNSDAEAVIIGTPIDLRRIMNIDKPSTRVTYRLQEIGTPTLVEGLADFIT
ncbi:MAG: GTPase [Fidelibacterota bacterium]|nr:MAG: GTPase [Candidatus Neomarinimicrobiota bacterium]